MLGGAPGSTRFDTLRSNSPVGFASAPPALCLDPGDLDSSSTDIESPPPGVAFFYLVRATNACGDGGLGNSSNGVPRIGIACDGEIANRSTAP